MKRLLSSDSLNLGSGLPLEIQLTARSMHSSRGMLVKRLSTLKEIIYLPNIDNVWRWGIKKNCGWKIFKAPKFYFVVDMLTTLAVYLTRNMMPFYFSTTSTLDTPTLAFLWKKKLITNYPFEMF